MNRLARLSDSSFPNIRSRRYLHFAFVPQPQSNQHHTLIIEEFEPDVFRQLIEYIHTGCVTLQPRTLLGA